MFGLGYKHLLVIRSGLKLLETNQVRSEGGLNNLVLSSVFRLSLHTRTLFKIGFRLTHTKFTISLPRFENCSY